MALPALPEAPRVLSQYCKNKEVNWLLVLLALNDFFGDIAAGMCFCGGFACRTGMLFGLFCGTCHDSENQFHFQPRQSFPTWTEMLTRGTFVWSWAVGEKMC